MDVGYLSGIEELKLLNDTLSKEDRSEAAFLRCINYGKCLEELVRYTFSQRLRNENAVQSKLIQLIKNRAFRQFLGKSEYYHMMHFIYLASNNAAVDHTIEAETAALENNRHIRSCYKKALYRYGLDGRWLFSCQRKG